MMLICAKWLRGNGWLRAAAVLAGCAAVGGVCGCRTMPVERSRDLEAQCRRDLQQASQLRGLKLQRDVAIERERPEELWQSLARELEKPENRRFLAQTEVLLQQLRVLSKSDSLKALYLKLMGQQVAAYYDPATKRVVYVEGGAQGLTNSAALPLIDRFVYVHEFCHAVEDSHFDLERLTKESLTDLDRNLALTSLVEGDAMLTGLDSVFCEAPMNSATPLGAAAVSVMGRLNLSDEFGEMGGCPAFLSGSLLRPYLDGAVFSNRLRRESGWQAVDAVFEGRLPATTAEILFPERRFLRAFKSAVFHPEASLFTGAAGGVLTNRVGAMGMALWLGGDKFVQPQRYRSFLKGWMGDQIYLVQAADGSVSETVWLSYWERPGMARAFCRQVRRRLSESFNDTSWSVARDGRLVAIVWTGSKESEVCEARVKSALGTCVDVAERASVASWCADLPWPVRFPVYEDYSAGFELVGGHVLDIAGGEFFSRFTVGGGLLLRSESNPDRCYRGLLGGLVRYVRDERSDFAYLQVPVLAAWFRRGQGDSRQYQWSLLWGLAGYGNEREARVLSLPVWRK